MKGFVAIFVVILASAYLQAGAGEEQCAPHNCLKPEACEGTSKLKCNNGLTCCYYVRTEYRDKCGQWGGECSTLHCNPSLTIAHEKAKDCRSNEVCCVLVN